MKQQQLQFDKGITSVPSDAICSDNALERCRGMVYENGEYRVIQKPKVYMTSGINEEIDLLYIHKQGGVENRYIFTTSNRLAWGVKNVNNVLVETDTIIDNITNRDSIKISSVGKTLIVVDNKGMHYFLFSASTNSYKALGKIPQPDVDLFLVGVRNRMAGEGGPDLQPLMVSYSGSYDGIITKPSGTIEAWRPDENNGSATEDWNNLVVGAYAKNKKSMAEAKGFCEPFLARVAVELYDGTYTLISQPILLLPSITSNTYGVMDRVNRKLKLQTYGCRLHYINRTNYDDWKDIVKDVVIFISDGINIYDTIVDQRMPIVIGDRFSDETYMYLDGIFKTTENGHSDYHEYTIGLSDREEYSNCNILNNREKSEIENDITTRSIFYKLCGIGISADNTEKDIADKIGTHLLENITTQEQLGEDDYYSHAPISADFLYTYNNRLNIANVTRGFFEGYDKFLPFETEEQYAYWFYVKINTDTGSYWIRHIKMTNEVQGIYFYYPDSRAKHVTIYRWVWAGGEATGRLVPRCVLDADLKEHTGLNGAYYFDSLSSFADYEFPEITVSEDGWDIVDERTAEITEVVDNDKQEQLSNYVLQSEVNNPFVFPAKGYFRVGFGKVFAMSTITQAISEGQFGQFPLIVFTDKGIWTLSVSSTGFYEAAYPMSREICNNPKSVTQTDGAIFFTSKKGLMEITGSSVRCVSEQLSGVGGDFLPYLSDAHIAYDYRDSLLWIMRYPLAGTFVYSIKHGTFSKYSFGYRDTGIYEGNTQIRMGNAPKGVINNYPDFLIQNDDDSFFSLLERPIIEEDGEEVDSEITLNRYECAIETRPMKFENALALKSILQIKHIADLNEDATMTLRIYASNNLKNWTELHSLGGVPWKYYKFEYDFQNLVATDRFAGSIVVTQERRTNKLR